MVSKNEIIFPIGNGNIFLMLFVHTIPSILFYSMSKLSLIIRILLILLFNLIVISTYKKVSIIGNKIVVSRLFMRGLKLDLKELISFNILKLSGQLSRHYKIDMVFTSGDKIVIESGNIDRISKLINLIHSFDIQFESDKYTKGLLKEWGDG